MLKYSNTGTMSSIEKYLQHLDNIFLVEPKFFPNESKLPGVSGVTSIVYENIPEQGMVTGLTYGLSLVNHSDWKYSRPELIISVESKDIAWGQVAGFVANNLRGECPFCYEDRINFKEKIGKDSEMDAFFVFAPSIIAKEDYLNIDIGQEYKINISGLYPIYQSEVEVIKKIGLREFMHRDDYEMYNVKRKQIEVR